MIKMRFNALIFTALIGLAACSEETKQDLGLANTPPDEFSVVTRAPLSVPPDYALRPPRPGAGRPMEMSTRDQARQTVFGEEDVKVRGTYVDQNDDFLNKVGVQNADPNIRRVVDSEGTKDNRTTAERLLFMSGDSDQGEPLNPNEEMQRLRQEGVVGSPAKEASATEE